jgi:hypothetical protein
MVVICESLRESKHMVCWSGSSPVGCISIQVATTLSIMSDSLSLPSSNRMLGVLLTDVRSWICIWS